MSDQKNPQVEMYVKAISEKVAKDSGILEAATDKVSRTANKNAKEYELHKKLDSKGYNLKMHGTDGYVHRHSDGPDQGYIIRHKSGKVSVTDIDHSEDRNEKDYEETSRARNPHLSDAEHKEVAKAIHKDYSHTYGESTAPQINLYAQAIAEQAARERGELLEASSGEDKAVTKKIKSMTNFENADKANSKAMARDADHVFTHGHEHVYMTHPAGRDADQYIVHNTKTGNTHVVISGVEKHEPPVHSSVSKATLKKMHNFSMSDSEA